MRRTGAYGYGPYGRSPLDRADPAQVAPLRPSRLACWAARFPGLPTTRSDLPATVFALLGLLFYSGSLVAPLTPEGAQSSPMVQFLGLAFGLVAGVDVALRNGALTRLAPYYWPVLIPVGFVIASLLWSVEPMLSARRALGLICATAFGFWMVERFMRQSVFAVIAGAIILIVAANVIFALAVPSLGIHPALTDLGEPNPHVGAWRGLFDHKNDFGRMMALCVMVLWIAFSTRRSWRPVVGIALLLGYGGVLGSTSGQAAFLSVTVPLLVYTLARLRPLAPSTRAMVIVLAVPALITTYVFSQIVVTFVLGLLGKDPSLTGRTDIWLGTLQAIKGNMALGGGFGAGWGMVGERLFILTGIDVGHAHNGYLDLVTDLGIVGLVLMVAFYVGIFIVATRVFFDDRASETALLAIGISAFALIGNWVASFLILHNSLYWVLPVVAVMSLRRAQRPHLALRPLASASTTSAPLWTVAHHSYAQRPTIRHFPASPSRKRLS
ncbi:O-antigen ligase [Maritimibacter sp. DP1N21-5]|uniref:O-antigen ligase family protein n=1 Tax=Maritimibacter sp. DP1N21-5 TaxID=2836867 RepID=UPI001C44415E|nr:O-antigen ligase family protein [Maritimibacter sp. DP1N21-5]MBV7410318.1 O-antigen ligase family protein [Maritimibacter sp. DP1N21-5]